MTPETAERYHRQLDIVDQERLAELPVTIVGAGAIGSFTTFVLAKMGAHALTVWDFDEIEPVNLPNQFFPEDAVGRNKAEATARLVERFEGVSIEARPVAFEDGEVGSVVVTAVDSIEVRRAIWEHVRFRPGVDLLIDGRMGAEVAELHAVRPDRPRQVRAYGESLHDPVDAVEAPCTAKSTIWCAGSVASLIAGTVVKFLMQRPFPRKTVFDLAQTHLVTER